MIGMWSAAQNRERLEAIEWALDHQRNLSDEERGDLEDARDELRGWFMDLWRIEGGGVRDG